MPDDKVYLDAAAMAYLRGGRFAAVVTALAALHKRGLVVAGRAGTVRRTERYDVEPPGFEHVVWHALHGSVSPAGLTIRPPVERAIAGLRRQLRDARLIHPLLPVARWAPARNDRGHEALRLCRLEHPLIVDRPETSGDNVAWLVALYGNEALRQLVPTFAKQGGLFDKNASDDMVIAEAVDRRDPPTV